MATKTKAVRRKRCLHCEELFPPDEIADGVCEECSEFYEWCHVCQAAQYTEGDHCRHIFWTDCGWAGAGAYEGDWDHFKGPFFAFLDVMAKVEDPDIDDYPDLVTGIEAEVGKHAFWTRLEGPMLGTPDLRFYRLRPDLHRDKDGGIRSFPFARISAGQIERDDDDAADGFGWLQSLCADDAKAANARTVEWIREWRAARDRVVS